jgi:hypothetical protein
MLHTVSAGDESHLEVEFRWKEEVIVWDGTQGAIFPSGWGVSPFVTSVPDANTWDRAVPPFLRGRRDEVLARMRAEASHVLHEEHDDWPDPHWVRAVLR